MLSETILRALEPLECLGLGLLAVSVIILLVRIAERQDDSEEDSNR